ncbi:SDR family oxidoreductase [Yoonia sp. BS5-3]|uniref:SDR family NAD(P)-dependent oxidoreductase n=1 Tax=Yoonia phaeophyticola TaxID=3137369 RepID=A0ABZ2V3J9_9RHOB
MTAIHPDLAGASIFVTGGASGIGAALVAGFVAQGAKVAFVDLLDPADQVATLSATATHLPIGLQCDITDTGALEHAMDQAVAAHGPFKAVVNNAANDQRYALEAVTPEIWDDVQAVNLKSYFFSSQLAAARMGPNGSIVNYTSISYMVGTPSLIPYATANAGISGLTRSLARELGGKGMRVNAIAPGWVLTEKQEKLWATPEGKANFLKTQCLPRHMRPDDLVGPTLFLASDASAMMTGQTMVVDAGVVTTG